MSYVVKQGMIDRFGERELVQLTDRANKPPTTIDDDVLDEAMSDAADLIDGYLAKLYTLPLTVVPGILTRMAADIARYYLHGKSADKDGAVHRAYQEAMTWLKDVAAGRIQLEAEGVLPEQSGGGSVRAKASDRVFTRDSLKDA
ncbi:DUF1320 domain-containing protein [Nitratireductor mangrovi]|uniref:DUF1320 domain-containing protein n=1 Tax=Nitratireductor mangrovi TaxID=2599600 RepID=A0A5B8KTX6_9HYPH|nr:DUF1320 domain-containing protein [Nitratireductor mangrovi]QDY99065.1 DUF1320 domain-containing protein [Nitratireductor mangrovi]